MKAKPGSLAVVGAMGAVVLEEGLGSREAGFGFHPGEGGPIPQAPSAVDFL